MGCGCGNKQTATPEQIAEAQRLADERREATRTPAEEAAQSQENALANAASH
jgi:hypothetical protein